MRDDRIKLTDAFVCTELSKLVNFKDNIPRMAEYRIEHSRRVAHIAAKIATEEGFDEERAYIAGLLHDIGYSVNYADKEDYANHGRVGAGIARPFLLSLGYEEDQVNEMCFGIAIHVDDAADFDGERTPLALTIGDADNIDRFDAFRLYETLALADYRNMTLAEQKAFVEKKLERLTKFLQIPFGTETATKLWKEKIEYQIGFYQRLKAQINASTG